MCNKDYSLSMKAKNPDACMQNICMYVYILHAYTDTHVPLTVIIRQNITHTHINMNIHNTRYTRMHASIHRNTRATHGHHQTEHYTHTHTHEHTYTTNTYTTHTCATHGHHPSAVSRFCSPVSELPYRT